LAYIHSMKWLLLLIKLPVFIVHIKSYDARSYTLKRSSTRRLIQSILTPVIRFYTNGQKRLITREYFLTPFPVRACVPPVIARNRQTGILCTYTTHLTHIPHFAQRSQLLKGQLLTHFKWKLTYCHGQSWYYCSVCALQTRKKGDIIGCKKGNLVMRQTWQ